MNPAVPYSAALNANKPIAASDNDVVNIIIIAMHVIVVIWMASLFISDAIKERKKRK